MPSCEQAPAAVPNGPCGEVLVKRLKTLTKRLVRIDRAEESRCLGHKLERDQLEAIERKGEVEAQKAEVEALMKQLCTVETAAAEQHAQDVRNAGVDAMLKLVHLSALVKHPQDSAPEPHVDRQLAHMLERLLPAMEATESFSEYVARVTEPVTKACHSLLLRSQARPGAGNGVRLSKEELLSFSQLSDVLDRRVVDAKVCGPQPRIDCEVDVNVDSNVDSSVLIEGARESSCNGHGDVESTAPREAEDRLQSDAGPVSTPPEDTSPPPQAAEGHVDEETSRPSSPMDSTEEHSSTSDGDQATVPPTAVSVPVNTKSGKLRRRRRAQGKGAVVNEVQIGFSGSDDTASSTDVDSASIESPVETEVEQLEVSEPTSSGDRPKKRARGGRKASGAGDTKAVEGDVARGHGDAGSSRPKKGRGGRNEEASGAPPVVNDKATKTRTTTTTAKTTQKTKATERNASRSRGNRNRGNAAERPKAGTPEAVEPPATTDVPNVAEPTNAATDVAAPDHGANDKVAGGVPGKTCAIVVTSIEHADDILTKAMELLRSRPAAERHVSVVSKFRPESAASSDYAAAGAGVGTPASRTGPVRVTGLSYFDADGGISTVIVEVWRLGRLPDQLRKLLEDPTIIKVARGISGDRDALKRDQHVTMGPVRELIRMFRERGVALKGRPDIANMLNATLGLALAGMTDALEWHGDVTMEHLSQVSHSALATLLVYQELYSRPKLEAVAAPTGKQATASDTRTDTGREASGGARHRRPRARSAKHATEARGNVVAVEPVDAARLTTATTADMDKGPSKKQRKPRSRPSNASARAETTY